MQRHVIRGALVLADAYTPARLYAASARRWRRSPIGLTVMAVRYMASLGKTQGNRAMLHPLPQPLSRKRARGAVSACVFPRPRHAHTASTRRSAMPLFAAPPSRVCAPLSRS